MIYTDLSEREEFLATEIVDAAYKVHKELGPGLLEKIYEACFCYELDQKKIPYKRQERLNIHYKQKLFFDEELRVDVFVDGLVICELNLFWNCVLSGWHKLTAIQNLLI